MFVICLLPRKDFLIRGRGGHSMLICSTGQIEWVWHRLKTWGGRHRGHVPPVPPQVPTPMLHSTNFPVDIPRLCVASNVSIPTKQFCINP